MLFITRNARYDSRIPEDYQAARSQTNIFNHSTQEMSTIELRDIVHQKHANDRETYIAKFVHFLGEDRETFEIKQGKTIIIDQDLAITFRGVGSRGEAELGFSLAEYVVLERADMREDVT